MWENEHVARNARAKKSFSGSPQMWWAIGQWPIWPIGKSGAGWLFELHTLVLYRNEYWHHILINMQLGMVLLHWYIFYHYLTKHFYRLYNPIVLYTDISNIIYIYISMLCILYVLINIIIFIHITGIYKVKMVPYFLCTIIGWTLNWFARCLHQMRFWNKYIDQKGGSLKIIEGILALLRF